MAGIYIHIPFCVQACFYCDFHFSTNRKNKSEMVSMLVEEMRLRQDYLTDKTISTIYFGGGTPSLLEEKELQLIMNEINRLFKVSKDAEITLEANPDDLSKEKLLAFRMAGINRLSIGVQSFDESQLRFMNRAHNSVQAENSIRLAQAEGFDNISIDLIYGIPSPSHQLWQADLTKALEMDVQHISSYCLTIEPSTVFGRRKAKNLMPNENEEYNAQQFEFLMETLEANGFEQYEVSNFSKKGYYSKHNSSYWHNEHYLGIGPGAHSYNGVSRQFNVESNAKYLLELTKGTVPFSIEILDNKTLANEYTMTRLRTIWGMDYKVLEQQFNMPIEIVLKVIEKHQHLGNLTLDKSLVKLTKKGLLVADKITEDLFYI